MKSTNRKKEKNLEKILKKIARRLDMITVIILAKSGMKRKEIADILGISEKTIERMLPFRKLSKKQREK